MTKTMETKLVLTPFKWLCQGDHLPAVQTFPSKNQKLTITYEERAITYEERAITYEERAITYEERAITYEERESKES